MNFVMSNCNDIHCSELETNQHQLKQKKMFNSHEIENYRNQYNLT